MLALHSCSSPSTSLHFQLHVLSPPRPQHTSGPDNFCFCSFSPSSSEEQSIRDQDNCCFWGSHPYSIHTPSFVEASSCSCNTVHVLIARLFLFQLRANETAVSLYSPKQPLSKDAKKYFVSNETNTEFIGQSLMKIRTKKLRDSFEKPWQVNVRFV